MNEQPTRLETTGTTVLELGYCERCGTLSVHEPGLPRVVCRSCAMWLRWLRGEARP